MKQIFHLTTVLIVALFCEKNNVYAQRDTYSTLWGRKGETRDTARIRNFTEAGYRKGLSPIPDYVQSVNVIDYGAVGDGTTDNIVAFRNAIKACGNEGAVYIPAGTFLLSDSLIIKKSNICLRGAGQGTTKLLFPKGLEELYPLYNTTTNQSSWSWSGALISFQQGCSNVGIENLTVTFPDNAWAGHNFHERGYNAIGFSKNAYDGWVRNVIITGSDLGLFIATDSHHITLQNWTLDQGPIRGGATKQGHHGVNIYGGYNLLQGFTIKGKFQHDLSIEGKNSKYNVFHNGKGKDLCIDHHNHDQRNNLFTNLDMGVGSRPYESGGKAKPTGISLQTTYWNLYAQRDMQYCDQYETSSDPDKSRNNVAVGVRTIRPSETPDARGNWFETITPARLYPADLYTAQLEYYNLPMFGECPVYATSNDGNLPANVTDNNLNTRWAAKGDNEYLVLCLNEARAINSIKVAFYEGNLHQYKFDVLTSLDGLTWETALSGKISNGTTANLESFMFPVKQAKYVKIIGHTYAGSDQNSITEIEVPLSSSSPTTTVAPIADTYIRDGSYANNNYGTEESLIVKGDPSSGYKRETYLKFNLNDIAANFSSAKLRMKIKYANTNVSSARWQLVFVPTNLWTETGLIWSNRPASTSLISTVSGVSSGFVEWDVKDILQRLLNAGNQEVSLRLANTVADSKGDAGFHSREASNVDDRPMLIVNYGTTGARVDVSKALSWIEESEVAKTILAYPNPFESELTIEADESDTEIRVYNNVGQSMVRMPVLNQKSVRIATGVWPSGMYYVSWLNETGVRASKRVIRK
ncbi:DNRLRE domain-containing protein [Spirosoma aureum]|uniref:DNRLRE domain-containing protein n=1 Tax=Spirosoma aureum TaxID=2692134 RepID=A0A6G9AJ30_9BACT|nr:DNRLRE domain-containing protein [Spirosoma aureum]QIP12460.1 DNRLRE domain-containing protein [Spirosoma aureum]